MGIVELIKSSNPELKKKKFDLARKAFSLGCGWPKPLFWNISKLLEDADNDHDWKLEEIVSGKTDCLCTCVYIVHA